MYKSGEIKYLCHICIGDKVLQSEIKKEGSVKKCDFCGERRKAVKLENVADRVDEIYREFCRPEKPYQDEVGDHPENIIAEMLESDIDVAEEIVKFLSEKYSYAVHKDGEDDYYDTSSCYVINDVGDYDYYELWKHFCYKVKHVARFFDSKTIELLEEIFDGIKNYPSIDKNQPLRVIKPGDPDSIIFRARQADDDQSRLKICLEPHKELGPTPGLMAKPNRMNPAGISVFYGAFDKKTCVSELRLPVGGVAITGKFKITRPIMVLDLLAIKEILNIYSMFGAEFNNRLQQINFFRRLDSEISKPVLPSDEMYEYIPTQALAEYLAKHFEPKIDGVIYSSAQTEDGKNIVLFHNASKVDLPRKKIKENNEKPKYKFIWHDHFFDIIKKPEKGKRDNKMLTFNINDIDDYYNFEEEMDNRNPTLKFVTDSLELQKVTSTNHLLKSLKVYLGK